MQDNFEDFFFDSLITDDLTSNSLLKESSDFFDFSDFSTDSKCSTPKLDLASKVLPASSTQESLRQVHSLNMQNRSQKSGMAFTDRIELQSLCELSPSGEGFVDFHGIFEEKITGMIPTSESLNLLEGENMIGKGEFRSNLEEGLSKFQILDTGTLGIDTEDSLVCYGNEFHEDCIQELEMMEKKTEGLAEISPVLIEGTSSVGWNADSCKQEGMVTMLIDEEDLKRFEENNLFIGDNHMVNLEADLFNEPDNIKHNNFNKNIKGNNDLNNSNIDVILLESFAEQQNDSSKTSECGDESKVNDQEAEYLDSKKAVKRLSVKEEPLDKKSSAYLEKRQKNNHSVRKSREKAKKKRAEVERKVGELTKENEGLRQKVSSLEQELHILRNLLTSLAEK